VRGLGIEPKVELMPRVRHFKIGGLDIVRLRIEAATMMTMPLVSDANSGSMETASAMLVSGPAA